MLFCMSCLLQRCYPYNPDKLEIFSDLFLAPARLVLGQPVLNGKSVCYIDSKFKRSLVFLFCLAISPFLLIGWVLGKCSSSKTRYTCPDQVSKSWFLRVFSKYKNLKNNAFFPRQAAWLNRLFATRMLMQHTDLPDFSEELAPLEFINKLVLYFQKEQETFHFSQEERKLRLAAFFSSYQMHPEWQKILSEKIACLGKIVPLPLPDLSITSLDINEGTICDIECTEDPAEKKQKILSFQRSVERALGKSVDLSWAETKEEAIEKIATFLAHELTVYNNISREKVLEFRCEHQKLFYRLTDSDVRELEQATLKCLKELEEKADLD